MKFDFKNAFYVTTFRHKGINNFDDAQREIKTVDDITQNVFYSTDGIINSVFIYSKNGVGMHVPLDPIEYKLKADLEEKLIKEGRPISEISKYDLRGASLELAKKIFYSQNKNDKIIGCVYTVSALTLQVEESKYRQVSDEIRRLYGSLSAVPEKERKKYNIWESIIVIGYFPLEGLKQVKIYKVENKKLHDVTQQYETIKDVILREDYEQLLAEFFN
ncbi:MAG: hypothetical protein NZ927_05770 [Candidatus Calescibacterium sp.]|nr:hypothetical protein [Candidatus Calescibacterium sp.]MCX7734594.1 hypothetical protein [bacterium]MDW8086520.1 hypothetical protein [Candidatus Calescibacterium sp.]